MGAAACSRGIWRGSRGKRRRGASQFVTRRSPDVPSVRPRTSPTSSTPDRLRVGHHFVAGVVKRPTGSHVGPVQTKATCASSPCAPSSMGPSPHAGPNQVRPSRSGAALHAMCRPRCGRAAPRPSSASAAAGQRTTFRCARLHVALPLALRSAVRLPFLHARADRAQQLDVGQSLVAQLRALAACAHRGTVLRSTPYGARRRAAAAPPESGQHVGAGQNGLCEARFSAAGAGARRGCGGRSPARATGRQPCRSPRQNVSRRSVYASFAGLKWLNSLHIRAGASLALGPAA